MAGIDPVPAMLTSGPLAFLAVIRAFQLWGPRAYPVAHFELASIESDESGELLLTDEVIGLAPRKPVEELVLTISERLGVDRAPAVADSELLLDDVLAEIGPESRVVRLFDPAAMPTAGELQSRIERHLGDGDPAGDPEAAQALNDAILNLRRSLR